MDFNDNSYIRRALNVIHDTATLPINYFFPLSPSDNFRDSQMSDDFLPSTPTTTDTLADSSSSEESSPEFEEDDLYDREKKLSVHDESPAVDTLHTSVINEMKEKGLFKQLEAIKENKISNGRHEIENKVNNGIESPVAANEAPEPPPHQAIDKYSGVNEKVKESLITMERLVAEMGQTEEQFVNMLTLMIRTFPEYLSTCKLKGRKYTSKFKETVAQIVKELEPVLQVHESLLNDLVLICLSWDSRMPNLSHVLLKNIDFLQICVSFLMKKNRLCEDFKSNIDADTECKHATRQFEDQIMNNPEAHGPSRFESMVYKPLEKTGQTSGVSYHQQLDVIHQNVVRYKIFSDRYADLLDPLCEDETAATKLVIEKLDKIVNTINSKLEEPHAVAFLLEIYDKLQSHNFNILMPGRRFG
uniref:DH domain-containing protein n=1 Tax=Panagrolaimus superbus TaxID=310955 RepID=A0A914Z944_9BILA